MIYFDNAATSWPRAPRVSSAIFEALQKAGNPGRGAHFSANWAAEKIYSVREKIAALFNIEDPLRISFTHNATYALNMAVNMAEGEILTTSMEHNSVLRPVFNRGYYSIVKADPDGHLSPEKIINNITDKTGTVIMTHGSNVTGEVYDIKSVANFCKKKGILFILDCSQTAGIIPVDVRDSNINVLCFPGHKGLMGPQGTGGIYVDPDIKVKPLISGGTGSQSFLSTHPTDMPECFEPGTLNTHGLAGLGAALEFVNSIGIKNIHSRELSLRRYFIACLGKMSGVRVMSPGEGNFTGTVSIVVDGFNSGEVAQRLADKGIGVRGGYHCAPLAHETLGSEHTGTVRFSFGYFNNTTQIDFAVRVLRQIIETKHKI